MIRKSASMLATAVLAGVLAVALFAAPAQAALRHIDGTVASKNSDNRTFKLTTQNGNTVRIKVNSATKFEGIGGFGSLKKGMRIEVDAQSTDSGLLAKHVEPRGGGGGGADDNGGGGGGGADDDGPNHT